jgi:pyruvate,orthophosphate dikinase
MQIRAILKAILELSETGTNIVPRIMLPLISHVNEFKKLRTEIEQEADKLLTAAEEEVDYQIGTMIELPRACLTADEIAKEADFFSFGTNDLTQTTFGFSRDDAENKFLPYYVEEDILPHNPFMTLDEQGVGKLIKLATSSAREVKEGLSIGICGEHGGDPQSIKLCNDYDLQYVSCSPYRVPIARLAAAKAAITK